jgi:hypothetical protein
MRTYDTDTTRKRWLNTPILHIFNAAGNFVLSKRLTLVENSVDSTVYFYDSANRLSRQLTYGKKRQLRDSISYTYFNDGSKVEQLHLSMRLRYEHITIITYDVKGNPIHEYKRYIDTTSSNGVFEMQSIITNQYNKFGWLVKTIKTRVDLNPYKVSLYKYDKKGNKIEFREILGEEIWEIDRYNAKGDHIEAIFYQYSDEIQYHTKMLYNQWRDQIRQTSSGIYGKPFSPDKIEYEYDSQHNWTKRTWYSGSEMISVAVRDIEYY